MYLTVFTIHILLGGGAWLITGIALASSFFYHMIYYLVTFDPAVDDGATSGAFISMYFIVYCTYIAMAYICEKRDKINFCIIKS